MISHKYHAMTTDELVNEFFVLCVAQHHSIEREEFAKFRRQYNLVEAIQNELKSRPGDQRRALQVFFGQGNLQVRYVAAHANLTIDYDKARQELKAIAATKWHPQAAEASMTLRDLDSGFYRPT